MIQSQIYNKGKLLFKNGIYELLEINEKNEAELNYLIELCKQFNIIQKVQEGIFQFDPQYDSTGRIETFAGFYKSIAIFEIINYLLILFAQKDNRLSNFFQEEDFVLYNYDKVLNNIENPDFVYIKFLLKVDLSKLTTSEILNMFSKTCEKDLEIYFSV